MYMGCSGVILILIFMGGKRFICCLRAVRLMLIGVCRRNMGVLYLPLTFHLGSCTVVCTKNANICYNVE